MCKWLGIAVSSTNEIIPPYRLSANWVDSLLLILLSVRTALKEDIGACTAELVYGMTLHIPGAVFASLTNTPITDNPANYVVKLKDIFRDLKANSPRPHNQSVCP